MTLILFQQLANISCHFNFFSRKRLKRSSGIFYRHYETIFLKCRYKILHISRLHVSANVILRSHLTQFYALYRSIIGLVPSKSDLEIFIKYSVVSVIVIVACLLSPRF